MRKPTSVRKLRKRISFLESIDLAATNKEKVCNLIRHSFKIPFNEFLWEAEKRKPIYRSCSHDNKKPEEKSPYSSISRISYNPNPSKELGRAYFGNGKVVSFASNGFDIAIIESCQDSLRNTKEREFYVTVGEWVVTENLYVSIVCHNKAALKQDTDLSIAYRSLYLFNVKKGFSRGKLKCWNLKNKFFADQYAKKKIKSKNDYMYSAIHANTNLNHKGIDGILYPSQAYEYKGFNFAFPGNLIDKGKLKIRKAIYARIKFSTNVRDYPEIEIIKETSTFVKDTIVW